MKRDAKMKEEEYYKSTLTEGVNDVSGIIA